MINVINYLLNSLRYNYNYTVVTRLGSATIVGVLLVVSLARHDNCNCMDVATFDNNISTRIRSSLLTVRGIASRASSKKFLSIKGYIKNDTIVIITSTKDRPKNKDNYLALVVL